MPERVCSTVKVAPHTQYIWGYIRDGDHPYLSTRASVKAPTCRQNPYSSIGRDVSQVEAPLSLASSIALLVVLERIFASPAACAAS